MYTDVNDTIVAISSARGHGRRGIVRLSGSEAGAIAARLCVGAMHEQIIAAAGFAQLCGELAVEDGLTAPVTVFVFRAPRSYTRQDLIELHTIGSPPLLDMIVERCLAAGARPAEAGEFTARAFLSGALSLSAAEAVAATIQARSDDQLRAARAMLDGHLAEQVRGWQDELADLLALVVADIDFAEEPIDFITPQALVERVADLRTRLEGLMASAASSTRSNVLPHILLLGAPNAGKSTLLNRLSGMDRAIASAVAGTTRDILTASVRLGAQEAVLMDAAGIDDDPDEIVAHGRQRALDEASRVDLVVVVCDASVEVDAAGVEALLRAAHAPTLLVATKCDAAPAEAVDRRVGMLSGRFGRNVVAVSAFTGAGMELLRAALEEAIVGQHAASEDVRLLLNTRQQRALADAAAALGRCAALADSADTVLDVAEFVAVDLQEGLDALGTISGAVTTEDLLGRVFANFCIGK